MDRELHQGILQMFEEDSDEEDFLGFTDSGMEEENYALLQGANHPRGSNTLWHQAKKDRVNIKG